eukprot:m.82816 g.82816  ORF g.82816 m.82816 type:complete len:451 (+) comp12889_c0_seq4:173-1525(+)
MDRIRQCVVCSMAAGVALVLLDGMLSQRVKDDGPSDVERLRNPPKIVTRNQDKIPVRSSSARPPLSTYAGTVDNSGEIPEELRTKLWQDISSAVCPISFTETVATQLQPWTAGNNTGISTAMLDRLYCIRKQVARVSIVHSEIRQVNWQLTMDHSRLRSAFWFLHLAINRAKQRGNPIPDVEFIMNPTDKTSNFASGKQRTDKLGNELRQAPLFCNVKCGLDASISFPLYYHTIYGLPDGQMSLDMYYAKYNALKGLGRKLQWTEKKDKLFFSSSNTRGFRGKLFEKKSSYIEALSHNVPLSQYGDYKYLVYTYGHSGWSGRLRELAFINTTLLMETTECREFFVDSFVSGVDFVPVAEDFSDIEEVLERTRSDPEKAQKMAASWYKKGEHLMSLECVLDYIENLLREYAKLQNFVPEAHPDWERHYMNSSAQYFLDPRPPSLDMCRDHF